MFLAGTPIIVAAVVGRGRHLFAKGNQRARAPNAASGVGALPDLAKKKAPRGFHRSALFFNLSRL
jgi:hypothetical protein